MDFKLRMPICVYAVPENSWEHSSMEAFPTSGLQT